MKELQNKIDEIIQGLTDYWDGGSAVTETDVMDAKIELRELKERLRLYDVSNQRELLIAFWKHAHHEGLYNSNTDYEKDVDDFLSN